MMVEIKRQSPVQFLAGVRKAEMRNNWCVVLEYDGQERGPWLVDLCHKTRWDLQDANIAELYPCNLSVPAMPGECTLENALLINRLNRTQASVWHLGGDPPEMPAAVGCTDVSEATVLLGLFGPHIYSIAEKLSALDLQDPLKKAPFLLQGPFCHVPSQIVTLQKAADGSGGLLLACSRGYAESMVQAILESGTEFGLRPAGETRFMQWLPR